MLRGELGGILGFGALLRRRRWGHMRLLFCWCVTCYFLRHLCVLSCLLVCCSILLYILFSCMGMCCPHFFHLCIWHVVLMWFPSWGIHSLVMLNTTCDNIYYFYIKHHQNGSKFYQFLFMSRYTRYLLNRKNDNKKWWFMFSIKHISN